MTIVYKRLPDGAFVCGDTVTKRTSYAYPTSPHATAARKVNAAAFIAREMIDAENSTGPTGNGGGAYRTEYNARNWARLA